MEFSNDLPAKAGLRGSSCRGKLASVKYGLPGILALALGLSSVCLAQAENDQVRAKVVVIPIRGQIAKPELFILRRGLKEAI